MSEIIREDINIDGVLLALDQEEISRCIPFKTISPFFILQQILVPWLSGKKIDLTLYEVFKTLVFCIPRLNYALQRLKTFGEVDNRSIFKSFFDYFEPLHTSDFIQSEVSSGYIHANAR